LDLVRNSEVDNRRTTMQTANCMQTKEGVSGFKHEDDRTADLLRKRDGKQDKITACFSPSVLEIEELEKTGMAAEEMLARDVVKLDAVYFQEKKTVATPRRWMTARRWPQVCRF
jgi:hypothetical protein